MNDAVQSIEDNIPLLQLYAAAVSRNEAAADELVQECLMRALTKARTHQPGISLRAWLFTILHNLHVNGTRRNGNHLQWSGPEALPNGTSVAALQPSTVMQRAVNRAAMLRPGPYHRTPFHMGHAAPTVTEVSHKAAFPSGAATFRRLPGGGNEVMWNPQYSAGDPAFNAFLFEILGREETGRHLTVLRALARLEFDPWREAARLSGWPKDAALIAIAPY